MPTRHYFLPGQVILHLEHPQSSGYTTTDIANAVDTFLRGLDLLLWTGQFNSPAPASITTFPLPSRGGNLVSLVPLEMSVPYLNSDWDEDLIDRLYVMYLHINRVNGGPIKIDDTRDIYLHTVSPNWLFGAAQGHQTDSTGGPASLPVRANLTQSIHTPGQYSGMFVFTKAPQQIQSLIDEHGGVELNASLPNIGMNQGTIDLPGASGHHEAPTGELWVGNTTVVILDTIPIPMDIDRAKTKWPNHRLVKELLIQNNILTIETQKRYSFWNNWQRLINYQHLDNGYEMPDHGLFIAGVIHSIAPQAKLHLYEVLNKYGIGSLASIVWGLTTAINTYLDNTDKLIINCSFNLHTSVVTPRSLVTTTNPPSLYLVDPEIPTLVMDPSFHQFMTTSLERIMENIFTSGRVIVACAGNEAEVGKRRPEARYPAAYENVIGVGALPRNSAPTSGPWGVNIYQPATYSNLADVPTGSGYMTLGGEKDVENGVLGIYIHRFPKENAGAFSYGINDTGWAWWAGTSFAASIISAIIAATAGAVPARSVKTAHKLLSLSFPHEASIYQERVIPVDQV